MVFWLAVTIISVVSIVVPSYTSYKKQKMIEERKTNNLALAYQIMSARPDVTLADVEHLISISGKLGLVDKENENP